MWKKIALKYFNTNETKKINFKSYFNNIENVIEFLYVIISLINLILNRVKICLLLILSKITILLIVLKYLIFDFI